MVVAMINFAIFLCFKDINYFHIIQVHIITYFLWYEHCVFSNIVTTADLFLLFYLIGSCKPLVCSYYSLFSRFFERFHHNILPILDGNVFRFLYHKQDYSKNGVMTCYRRRGSGSECCKFSFKMYFVDNTLRGGT